MDNYLFTDCPFLDQKIFNDFNGIEIGSGEMPQGTGAAARGPEDAFLSTIFAEGLTKMHAQ